MLRRTYLIALYFSSCHLDNADNIIVANMYQIITDKCNEIGLMSMLNLFLADFKQAIHNAINKMFPLCKIIGCRFYLSQPWYRKIQNLGLSTDYKSETEIEKWLRNIFGLSFLNAVEVGESYTNDFMSTIPESHY
jgi:hypothetical protein